MNIHLTVQVPRSPDLDHTIDRLQHKLEPLLVAFQPELVQLQGRLVRHTSREGVSCSLNLHLPTAQISSEDTATTAQMAFRAASEELLRQVNKHKQRLRENRGQARTAGGNPQTRAPQLTPGDGAEHRAARAAARAQRRSDLAGYFGAHYQDVLNFIRRQIELREHLGELTPGSLDAAEVLDEVVVAALDSGPLTEPISRGRWLLLLAAGAIRKLSKTYSDHPHGQELHTLTADPPATDEPDPEEIASTTEMMDALAAALKTLPATQRHDLVLYLLEGFKPNELAQLSHRTPVEVETSLLRAESALRAQPDLDPALRQHLRLGAQPQRA